MFRTLVFHYHKFFLGILIIVAPAMGLLKAYGHREVAESPWIIMPSGLATALLGLHFLIFCKRHADELYALDERTAKSRWFGWLISWTPRPYAYHFGMNVLGGIIFFLSGIAFFLFGLHKL